MLLRRELKTSWTEEKNENEGEEETEKREKIYDWRRSKEAAIRIYTRVISGTRESRWYRVLRAGCEWLIRIREAADTRTGSCRDLLRRPLSFAGEGGGGSGVCMKRECNLKQINLTRIEALTRMPTDIHISVCKEGRAYVITNAHFNIHTLPLFLSVHPVSFLPFVPTLSLFSSYRFSLLPSISMFPSNLSV